MNKLRNKKTEYKGIKFDSLKECRRFQELELLQRAGHIAGLKTQHRIEICPKNKKFRAVNYVCDFFYYDETGQPVYEDVKGYKDGATYNIFKIKQFGKLQ